MIIIMIIIMTILMIIMIIIMIMILIIIIIMTIAPWVQAPSRIADCGSRSPPDRSGLPVSPPEALPGWRCRVALPIGAAGVALPRRRHGRPGALLEARGGRQAEPRQPRRVAKADARVDYV